MRRIPPTRIEFNRETIASVCIEGMKEFQRRPSENFHSAGTVCQKE
jgi:hypothetical protein